MKKHDYKIGDLVRLLEGVHQDEVPDHRMGVVVSDADPNAVFYPDVFDVLFFGNTEPLRFHKMYLEYVEKE